MLKLEEFEQASAKAIKQRELLESWLVELEKISEIELVWIEGSLVDKKRENPGSDIDIRFAIKDSEFDSLWDSKRERVFSALGRTYPLAPFRLVSERGVLIESEAYKTSQLKDLVVYEWQVLLDRIPGGFSGFKKDTKIGAAKWPHPSEVDLGGVEKLTGEIIHWLSIATTPFYHKNAHSALFTLELLQSSLMHVFYWRSGVRPFLRAKHLEQIIELKYLGDYEYVQFQEQEHSMDFKSIAQATLRTYETLIKHCKEIYIEIGCEDKCPSFWLDKLYKELEVGLADFIDIKTC